MRHFPFHTALTIAALALLMSAAPFVSGRLEGPTWVQLARLVDFTPERTPVSPLLERIPDTPVIPVRRTPIAPRLLEDANGGLQHFYESLALTEKGGAGAVTRIVHFGDSPTTADLITGDIRSLLQQRFGDAGQGFILVDKPWAWYDHHGVELSGSGWQAAPASRFAKREDGLFGLGGVSFTADGPAGTRIQWRDQGQSRFELYYLAQPGGGTVTVLSGGVALAQIDTEGEAKAAGFAAFTARHGADVLELESEGNVRVFGLTAEKASAGVVYDSLGLNGASITVLSRMFQERHLATELRHRAPDLVVVNYGTNEADFASFVDGPYEMELRESIRRIHAAVPEASVLIMSPMDRGRRNAGEIETMETIPRIIAIQRRVAADTGCGFFDTFTAMGGDGTMARWYAASPRLVSADLMHPNPAAGRQIAEIFVAQIEAGLSRFKLR